MPRPELSLLHQVALAGAAAASTAQLSARLLEALRDELELAEATLALAEGEHRARGPGALTPAARSFSLGPHATLRLVPTRESAARFDALPWEEGLSEALAALLRALLERQRALDRTAALSRRAHGERELLREELERSAEPFPLVARSPAMRALFEELAPRVAAQDVSVLLLGETGTGKELLARRLHALSRRARRPLLTVNCTALPESLAESQLFGHERGAFTGALGRHAGLFERADGGTLLLDEVGELSPSMQARLLRVLQDGTFERVGGTETLRADVRLLAATHRSLEQLVAEGRFRQDLYYRLSVVPLTLPPLRERPEDVEPLVHAALAGLSRKLGREPPVPTPQDLARLRAWRWPGNVRELLHLLERALVLSAPGAFALPAGWDRAPAVTQPSPEAPERFDDAQRRLLREALAASNGRVYGPEGAAAKLGMAPTTLVAKLERLGLRPERARKR